MTNTKHNVQSSKFKEKYSYTLNLLWGVLVGPKDLTKSKAKSRVHKVKSVVSYLKHKDYMKILARYIYLGT
jgi:hypothetical protein